MPCRSILRGNRDMLMQIEPTGSSTDFIFLPFLEYLMCFNNSFGLFFICFVFFNPVDFEIPFVSLFIYLCFFLITWGST